LLGWGVLSRHLLSLRLPDNHLISVEEFACGAQLFLEADNFI